MPVPGGRRDPATQADGRRRGRVRAYRVCFARQGRRASPRRAVSRTYARVMPTVTTAMAATTNSPAVSGSPTSPGPWPKLRGSPMPGVAEGTAARTARGMPARTLATAT